HLIERIHHLAALAMVRHILEVIEKCDCFEKRPTVWCHVVHSHPPLNESRGSTSIRRFSDSSRTSSPDCPGRQRYPPCRARTGLLDGAAYFDPTLRPADKGFGAMAVPKRKT